MAKRNIWDDIGSGLLAFGNNLTAGMNAAREQAWLERKFAADQEQRDMERQFRRDQLADASYQRQFTREQAMGKAMDDYNAARRNWEQTRAIAGPDLAGPEPTPPSILQGSGLMGGPGMNGGGPPQQAPQNVLPPTPSQGRYGPVSSMSVPESLAPSPSGVDLAGLSTDIQGTQKLPGFMTGARTDKLIPEFDNRLNAFAQAYLAATGEPLQLTDSYRDYAGQVDVKNRKGGWAATPGNSMHGYGAAVDINPTQADKAASLGLLGMYGLDRPLNDRAQRPEPWHIQPVGLDEQGLRATGPSGNKPGSDYSGFLALMDSGKQPQGTAQSQAPQRPWDMGTNVAQAGGPILTDAGGRAPSSQPAQPGAGQGQASGHRDIRWWVNNATDADLARLSVVKPDLAKTVFEIRKRNEPPNDIKEYNAYAGMTPEQKQQFAEYKRLSKAETNVNIDGGKKFQQTLGELWAKDYQKMFDDASNAQDVRNNVQAAKQLMAGGLQTGALEPAKAQVAALAQSVGVDPAKLGLSNASDAQKFNSVVMKNLLAELVVQKGPQTEGDASRALKTFAQLGNTPEANQFALDYADAVAQRKQEMADYVYQTGREKYEGDSFKAKSDWQKKINGTPLFASSPNTGKPVTYYQFRENAMSNGIPSDQIDDAWRKFAGAK